jgi:hypothetical protein
VQSSRFPTGLSAPDELSVSPSGDRCGDALYRSWMTDELVDETRRIWSPIYGRDVSKEEAMEMLTNVKRFAETLLKVQRSMNPS